MYFCKFEGDSFAMKRFFLIIIAIAALGFSSCSNKVDLYSYDSDTTVIYAILDASADTNFFKITHSFVGDVSQLSHNYEASNYNYDEIDVKFSGVFEGSSQSQTITLDTVSKWIPYDENAQFYSGCRQTYYFTTKKLLEGKEYTVNVLRKADSVNISAKAMTINKFNIRKPISVQQLQFKDVRRGVIEWKVTDATTMNLSTASYFEITAYFHYTEKMPGSSEIVSKSIRWHIGSDKAEDFLTTQNSDVFYTVSYTPEVLYDILRNNQYLKENSPYGVKRWFDKFEIKVSAMGEDLYNYYLVTNSTSAIQDVPNYSNIENGMGIMSSRVSRSNFYTIAELSRNYVVELFPEYGFIVDPNR